MSEKKVLNVEELAELLHRSQMHLLETRGYATFS